MTLRHTENLYLRLLEKQRDLPKPVPCEASPEIFFPEDIPEPAAADLAIEVAKAMCGECPIMRECRDYAMQAQKEYGIWGSITAAERLQP